MRFCRSCDDNGSLLFPFFFFFFFERTNSKVQTPHATESHEHLRGRQRPRIHILRKQLAWNPAKPILASCSADKTVRMYSYSRSTNLFAPAFTHTTIPTGHTKTVRSFGLGAIWKHACHGVV